jgi:hypothetical protein
VFVQQYDIPAMIFIQRDGGGGGTMCEFYAAYVLRSSKQIISHGTVSESKQNDILHQKADKAEKRK